MIYAGILEVHDQAKHLQKEESWAIPEALSVSPVPNFQFIGVCDTVILQDNLWTYATAFLLCPTLATYHGKVTTKLILSFLVGRCSMCRT
jgi:hypothetical protein